MSDSKLLWLWGGLNGLGFGALTFLCFNRSNFFLQHLENLSPLRFLALAYIFFGLCLAYMLFCYLRPTSGRFISYLLAIVIFLGIIAPPLLSRDIGGYMIGTKLFFADHYNPYHTVLSTEKSWSAYLGNLWWLREPYAYGPLMLVISFLPWLLSFNTIMVAVYSYKLLVLATAIASFIIFRKLRRQEKLPQSVDWLFLANPTLIINFIYEGHNDIFVLCALLLTLFLYNKPLKKFFLLAAAIFIKYSGLIFWPLAWFKHNKFSFKQFFISSLGLASTFSLFLIVSRLSLNEFIQRLLFFTNHNCFYRCSPVIKLFSLFPETIDWLRTGIFVLLFIYCGFRFLFKTHEPLKFVFWSGFLLFFVQTEWLTPWYPCLLIPFGLLLKERHYRVLVILLTLFSLFHYLGWV